MTKFGEISPLWQNLIIFQHVLWVYLVLGEILNERLQFLCSRTNVLLLQKANNLTMWSRTLLRPILRLNFLVEIRRLLLLEQPTLLNLWRACGTVQTNLRIYFA